MKLPFGLAAALVLLTVDAAAFAQYEHESPPADDHADEPAPATQTAKEKDSAFVFTARVLATSGSRVGGGPDVALHASWLRVGLFADYVDDSEADHLSTWDAGARAGFGLPLGEHWTWTLEGIVASRRYDWNPSGEGLLDIFDFRCAPPSFSSTTAVFGAQSGVEARFGRFFFAADATFDRDRSPAHFAYAAHRCDADLFSAGGSYPAGSADPSPTHIGMLARVGGLLPF